MSGVERLSQGAHACLRELLSSSGDSLSRAAPARGIWCYRVRRLTAERCLTCDKRGPTTTLVTKPRKRQGRHDLRSQRPLQLPLLGSNQDSPDPESGVLPVTPRGSALDFFLLAKRIPIYPASTATSSLVSHRFWGTMEHLPYRPGTEPCKHQVAGRDRGAPRQRGVIVDSFNSTLTA